MMLPKAQTVRMRVESQLASDTTLKLEKSTCYALTARGAL